MSNRKTIQPNSTSRFYKKEAKKLLKQFDGNNLLALDLFDDIHPQKSSLKEVKL